MDSTVLIKFLTECGLDSAIYVHMYVTVYMFQREENPKMYTKTHTQNMQMHIKICKNVDKHIKTYKHLREFWYPQRGHIQQERTHSAGEDVFSWRARAQLGNTRSAGEQHVWLPRLMGLVRLIYLGFLKKMHPPNFYTSFYNFMNIFCIFWK